MRRREFITTIGGAALAWPLEARAQQATSPKRVGFLLAGLSPESREVEAFRRELRKAGYIEGRNLVMEWRSANGDYDRVPALVADLVRSNVDVLLNLASAARLPTIYETRRYPDTGGLMSYGPDINDLFRRAAIYVNRIFEGEKPADLPVEQPTKFELVINLRTAKTLELVVPDKLIALADDVIE